MSQLALIGSLANAQATGNIFRDYRARKAENTVINQDYALQLWANYLQEQGAEDAANKRWHLSASAWAGVTWGLVDGFVRWMLRNSYAIATINHRLSVIKIYARLAARAGAIPADELTRITTIQSYGHTEGKRVDRKRDTARRGSKKEDSLTLGDAQARKLKTCHDDTPQGARDRLIMTLLLDLGLRTSELVSIEWQHINGDQITIHRKKTNHTDLMVLSPDCRAALDAWRPYRDDGPYVLRSSRKGGILTSNGMGARAINKRVWQMGRDWLGIQNLSPHDLRHTWATNAARHSSPFALRDAGGWKSMQTPARYVERAKVVNNGIQLSY